MKKPTAQTMTLSSSVIQKRYLISREKASETAKKVQSLSDLYIDRGHFDTLGPAAYLDDPFKYIGLAAKHNGALVEAFSDVYRALFDGLGEFFGKSVVFHPNGAVPGFHVFTGKSVTAEGEKHLDTPYQRVLWPEPFDTPFSFTVALTDGAGMNVWTGDGQHYEPYGVGLLYIHTGLFYHQIAKPAHLSDDNPRITLQGHGARLGFSDKIAVYF